ncbi:MAG: N-acetylglucosamine-6-phosphate deacetylase [Bacteroidales bacterium]|nr:N-acetylglucosamine-6-phosphate deacetylase [Bacteroidales bacterium]
MITEDIKAQIIVSGIHYATGKPVSLEIRDGRIIKIAEPERLKAEEMNLFIAPGLIDNQINGYANIDFSGSALSASGVIDAAKAIWSGGVTTFLPTLITGSHETLLKNFRILNEALTLDSRLAGSVPGFHLEGPYISPDEGFRGCHPVQYIRKPLWEEFIMYQEAAAGKIIQVTLAPELEGAMEFIRLCRHNGIIVAMGHTNSTAAEISAAADEGVTLSTHLGNGCANYIHRHNNPIWPQLANEKLTATVIADGFHLLPEELKVFLRSKGPHKLILTSDVIYLAGMAPGKYTFLESEVMLTEEGMLKNIAMNCLAGASFPLKTGVGNMIKFTGCSLEEAVNMATQNVAAAYGLNDRGSLSPGKRGDIILFEKNADKLIIRKTYLNGELVFHE